MVSNYARKLEAIRTMSLTSAFAKDTEKHHRKAAPRRIKMLKRIDNS